MLNKEKVQNQIEEYLKCKNDFIYYATNYVNLQLPGGPEPIKMYDKQKELIDFIQKEHYVIVMKSRQLGVSTILQVFISWIVVFNDNVSVAVISKSGEASTKFSRNIVSFIDNLPKFLRPKYEKKNERSFILASTKSSVINTPVDAKNPSNCLRSESITFLVIDECAFIPRIQEAWDGIVPSLATSQKQARDRGIITGTILLSTPNKSVGNGAFYYTNYMDAVNKTGIFKDFTLYWRDVPEIASDPTWYETQCQMLKNDPNKIQQELELKFISTEGSFLPEDILLKMQENAIEPIKIQKIFNSEIRTFEEPKPNTFYILGVDIATTYGEDCSVVEILDYETLDQVCEFQGKCEITDFVKIIELLCTLYPGLLVVEDTLISAQMLEQLNHVVLTNTTLYHGKLKSMDNNKVHKTKPGLQVNLRTRPLILTALYEYILEFPLAIKSKSLILELVGLEEHNGKIQASKGLHDDLPLALSYCHYVRKYDPPLLLNNANQTQINDFRDILNMNKSSDLSMKDNFNNGDILKYIKSNLDNNDRDKLGFVDIFNLYGE